VISRYLAELDAELRVGRRLRARILAEAADHLHEATARELERGTPTAEAERRAVEAFGRPEDVAGRFHEQLAAASAHRSAVAAAALVVGFVALFAVTTSGPASAHGGWANDLPYGLIGWLGAQVAVVAAVLALVRSLRYRGAGVIPGERLADLWRASAVAVICVGAAALAEGAGALAHLSRVGESGWTLGLTAGAAVLALASLAAAGVVLGAVARARVLAPEGEPAEDALDDLLAVARLAPRYAEGRAPRLAGALRRLGVWGAEAGRLVESSPALRRWLDLRRSPWRFCAVFAATCGIGFAASHALADGGLSASVPSAAEIAGGVAAGLLIASIEAAAVALCFLLLGRFLGIRRSRVDRPVTRT
jgi:hypothetical protein